MTFATQFDARKERGKQLGVVPRLGNEVGGATLQRPHRLVGIGIRRHEDDYCLRIAVQNVLQPLKTFFAADGIAREIHIQQHDVGMQQLVESVYLFGLFRHTDILYQWLQQQIQRKENVFVVVNDEYFAFFPFHLCFVLSFRWQR